MERPSTLMGMIPNYGVKTSYLDKVQPFLNRNSISVTKNDEDEKRGRQFLENEYLRGSVKSLSAIKHKFNADKAILE